MSDLDTPKLTKAQLTLLQEIEAAPQHVNEAYKPRQRLVELGFVAVREIRYSDICEITEAGRLALKAAEARSGPPMSRRAAR